MRLRDEVEQVLKAWDAYEATRTGPPVVDYDFSPDTGAPEPIDRVRALARLERLEAEAAHGGDTRLAARIAAHVAYLRCLLGQRPGLDEYVRATQGCPAAGWPPDHVEDVGKVARTRLEDAGVSWGRTTEEDLQAIEGAVAVDDVAALIDDLVRELEPPTRQAVGTSSPYTLSVETVDVDDYWAYWLDGAHGRARLRLNTRQARFSSVRVRALVLHEIMGHALQAATWTARSAHDDVPWVRLSSVHAPQQVLLEGLAQALPLFVCPADEALVTRVRLAHYLQLVRAELHVAVNAGASVAACVEHARRRAPFWDDATIGDILTDRGSNILLRSYLWSYPAGIDWFVAVADQGGPGLARTVLRAAYEAPCTPGDLEDLWPAGPAIGGPGGSIALRD